MFLPPDSIGEFILQFACELAPQSQEKRLETVFELTKFVEEEEEKEKQDKLTEQQKNLQSTWVRNIQKAVWSNWNYQGADDDWWCELYVLQKINGEVVTADVNRCKNIPSNQEEGFKGSIIRAVFKASPLPPVPDESIFEEELVFVFSSNR